MKMKLILKTAAVSFAFFAGGGFIHAQFSVAVAADPLRSVRWVKEDFYWEDQLSKLERANNQLDDANTELMSANKTLASINTRIGDPELAGRKALEDYADPSALSFSFINDDLKKESIMRAKASFVTISRVNHATGKSIGRTYEIGEETIEREPARYRMIGQEERLHDTYNNAVDDFHEVQKAERAFQEAQTEGLKAPGVTLSEIQGRQTAIEASRGRVDLARNRLELARAALETFVGQVDLEERKGQAAEREEVEQRLKIEDEKRKRLKAKFAP